MAIDFVPLIERPKIIMTIFIECGFCLPGFFEGDDRCYTPVANSTRAPTPVYYPGTVKAGTWRGNHNR